MRQTTAPDPGSGLSKTGRTRLYPGIYMGLFPLRAEARHRNKRPRKISNQTLLIPLIARFKKKKKNPQWGPFSPLMSIWQNNAVEKTSRCQRLQRHRLTKRPLGREVTEHLFSILGQNFF